MPESSNLRVQLPAAILLYGMASSRKRPSLLVWLLVAVQTVLLLITAWRTGPGWDEWGHLPSGLYSLQYGDFHPYQVNPPLVRMLAAIPVVLLGGGIPPMALPQQPGDRSEVFVGLAYIQQQGPDLFYWCSVARTAVIPIAVFGTILIYRITTHFGGSRAGHFAAALWVFSPVVLAFSASITPDVASAVFGLWSAWCFWCWYRLGRTRDTLLLAVSVALAVLSKATWILLPPILLLMFLSLRVTCRSKKRQIDQWRQVGIAALVAWAIIHAAYDFRGTLKPLRSFSFVSQSLNGIDRESSPGPINVGNRFKGTWFGYLPAPLPANYIAGIDVQKRDFEAKMPSYLFGQVRDHGWWYYYAAAWVVKEPLAFWLILLFGWGCYLMRARKRRRPALACRRWGVFAVITPGVLLFLFVSSQTGFNHHLRYVLPAFPAAFLLAALPIRRLERWPRRVLGVLLLWFAASSVAMVPRSYAHFSELVGGWRNGHRYLNASNLDWGQDLPSIRRWAEQNPDKRPIHLLFSPSQLDFARLGIDATIAYHRIDDSGPLADGWWVTSIDQLLLPPQSWFLQQTPTERISVSTTVYQVEDGKVVEPSSPGERQ